MKLKPVLIFKSYLTGFPTALPASVYAMPDGTIYLVYTRFYEKDFSKTGLEYVFAGLEEFSIDFESGQLFAADLKPISLDELKLMLSNNELKLKIIKVSRQINSTDEALPVLNKLATKMLKNKSL
jgi:hypothetical protein